MNKIHLPKALMLLFAAGILLITSCKTEDDEDGIAGTWKVTAATFNPAVDFGAGPVTDAYPLMFANACDQDDLIIFQDNGVQIDDEGTTKCNSADPQQTTGTYSYSGTTLTIYNSDTITITNVNLTSSTLTGSFTIDFGGGNTGNVDVSLDRQ